MLRSIFLCTALLCAAITFAQHPPMDVIWVGHLDYGSRDDSTTQLLPRPPAPARIQQDQGHTYWMAEDSYTAWTAGHGVIRSYDIHGIPQNGYAPLAGSVGCGSLEDKPIDFVVRMDSLYGIATTKDLLSVSDTVFCITAPDNGYYEPDETLNGPDHLDGVWELLVNDAGYFACAWHETAPEQWDGRILAFGHDNTLLWQSDLPQYGELRTFTDLNDSIGVAGFPYIFWLDGATGEHTSTTVLYTGMSGRGKLIRRGTALYWATTSGDQIRYGKWENGATVWTGTAPSCTISEIAADTFGNLWIGGNATDSGVLMKVDADGTFVGSYPQGATLTDVESDGPRILWTGRTYPDRPYTYLIVGLPQ